MVRADPWVQRYHGIKARCTDPNNKYCKKGIKCLITKEELKILWFRDKAWLLERPSIDRIDNNGNYTLENCRFIEVGENAARARRRKVCNYKNGKLVRVFNSLQEAEDFYKISKGNIWSCCNNQRVTTKGYAWKYWEVKNV